MKNKLQIILLTALVGFNNLVFAQQSITGLGTPVSADFSSLSTTDLDNGTISIPNWTIYNKGTLVSPCNYSVDNSTSALNKTVGVYSLGPDYTLGARNSGASRYAFVWSLQNNSASAVEKMSLNYNVLLWRYANGSVNEKIRVFYSTATTMPTIVAQSNNVDISPGTGWTLLSESEFSLSALTGNAHVGSSTPKSIDYIFSNAISSGSKVWILFYYTQSAAQLGAGYGINNVSATFDINTNPAITEVPESLKLMSTPGSGNSKEISISYVNLTQNLNLEVITGCDCFTVDKASLDVTTGENKFNVTFTPISSTSKEFEGIVKISSIELEEAVFITLKGAPVTTTLPFTANFSYIAGSLLVDQTEWHKTHAMEGTPSGDISVSDETITYPNYLSDSAVSLGNGNTYDALHLFSSLSNSYFISALINVSQAKSVPNNNHIAIGLVNVTDYSAVNVGSLIVGLLADSASVNGIISTEKYRLGLGMFANFGNGDNSNRQFNYAENTYFNIGQTYLVVIKVQLDADNRTNTASLYINPNLKSDEPAPLYTQTYTSSGTGSWLYPNALLINSQANTPTSKVAGVKVANTWDELGTITTSGIPIEAIQKNQEILENNIIKNKLKFKQPVSNVRVYSVTGKLINTNNDVIDQMLLPFVKPGLYIVTASNSDGENVSQKFLVQ